MAFDPAALGLLILDDRYERRVALRAELEWLGVCKLRLAADEDEAIARLRAERIDAVVIDDGFAPGAIAFISKIRRQLRGHLQETAIILCVSADDAQVRAARDAGVTEMIAKPATSEALRVRLEEIVLRPRPFIRAPGYVGPCRRRRRALDWPFPDRRGGTATDETASTAPASPIMDAVSGG